MHARHRSPGNGYRSIGMGMGPEASARGRGFYNSEYRGFNRGFGRGQGQPKSFQPPPPTPRKGDIFMEAGRLAAEYLVSQGLLPSSVLSGKSQNGNFRSLDGDGMQLPSEGRTSALTRLGNSGSDVESGRRRYPDDYNSMGLGNYLKGRRKGSFRSYGSDWGREYGRTGSWSERNKISPDVEGDDDSYSGHQEEQRLGKDVDNGLQKAGTGGFAPKSEEAGSIEAESDKHNVLDVMGSRVSSSSNGKDLLKETDGEFSRKTVESTNMNVETGELKDVSCKDETEKLDDTEGSSIKHCAEEGDTLRKSNNDLLALCKFAKVPTKTRSSLSYKGLKADSVSNNDDENTSDIKPSRRSEVLVEDVSAADLPSNKTQESMCNDFEMSKPLTIQAVESVGALSSTSGINQGKCARSQSFPDRGFVHDTKLESVQELSDLQRSSSMVIERGEKRPMEDNDTREGAKKLREWFPSMVTKADEYFGMSNLGEKKAVSLEETASPEEKVILAFDQESSVNNYQFQKGIGEPCVEYTEEKQLFPGSFKICDLNLMEGSDLNENHQSDPTRMYPSVPKREATPVDIGLSMSNSSMVSEYSRRQSDCKAIEVIDLEDDSVQENKTNDNSERKTETMFTSLEGFPNNTQNSTQILDVPDNYDGLTITQLLNTFPDCPPVPGDINPLQNEMVLHNGEAAAALSSGRDPGVRSCSVNVASFG
ncbi:hypothetical protein KPL70_027162 [Citrus sinensis]|nr:hypothetical protein KPL70_027162 [Citrus sinensis]